jgi:hypothetical protein
MEMEKVVELSKPVSPGSTLHFLEQDPKRESQVFLFYVLGDGKPVDD